MSKSNEIITLPEGGKQMMVVGTCEFCHTKPYIGRSIDKPDMLICIDCYKDELDKTSSDDGMDQMGEQEEKKENEEEEEIDNIEVAEEALVITCRNCKAPIPNGKTPPGGNAGSYESYNCRSYYRRYKKTRPQLLEVLRGSKAAPTGARGVVPDSSMVGDGAGQGHTEDDNLLDGRKSGGHGIARAATSRNSSTASRTLDIRDSTPSQEQIDDDHDLDYQFEEDPDEDDADMEDSNRGTSDPEVAAILHCSNCSSTTTGKVWYNDKKEGKICQNCYDYALIHGGKPRPPAFEQIRLAKSSAAAEPVFRSGSNRNVTHHRPEDIQCDNCSATEDTCKGRRWRPSGGGRTLCDNCYNYRRRNGKDRPPGLERGRVQAVSLKRCANSSTDHEEGVQAGSHTPRREGREAASRTASIATSSAGRYQLRGREIAASLTPQRATPSANVPRIPNLLHRQGITKSAPRTKGRATINSPGAPKDIRARRNQAITLVIPAMPQQQPLSRPTTPKIPEPHQNRTDSDASTCMGATATPLPNLSQPQDQATRTPVKDAVSQLKEEFDRLQALGATYSEKHSALTALVKEKSLAITLKLQNAETYIAAEEDIVDSVFDDATKAELLDGNYAD